MNKLAILYNIPYHRCKTVSIISALSTINIYPKTPILNLNFAPGPHNFDQLFTPLFEIICFWLAGRVVGRWDMQMVALQKSHMPFHQRK